MMEVGKVVIIDDVVMVTVVTSEAVISWQYDCGDDCGCGDGVVMVRVVMMRQ